jgi:nucleoside-diphosphate-sugar epimerase
MMWRQIRRGGTAGTAKLTMAQYKFLLLDLDFNIDKARRELGYHPAVGFDEGIRRTMAWYTQKE